MNEAIIRNEETGYIYYVKDITEEIADCYVMLNQFQLYYEIENKQIEEIMKFKIDRQLERIRKENEKDNKNN